MKSVLWIVLCVVMLCLGFDIGVKKTSKSYDKSLKEISLSISELSVNLDVLQKEKEEDLAVAEQEVAALVGAEGKLHQLQEAILQKVGNLNSCIGQKEQFYANLREHIATTHAEIERLNVRLEILANKGLPPSDQDKYLLKKLRGKLDAYSEISNVLTDTS